MPFYLKSESKKKFEPVPAGSHLANLTGFYDIGTRWYIKGFPAEDKAVHNLMQNAVHEIADADWTTDLDTVDWPYLLEQLDFVGLYISMIGSANTAVRENRLPQAALDEIRNQMPKQMRKLLMVWEIPGHTYKIDEQLKPAQINKEFNLSMHKRSTLRQWIEIWRGEPFTDESVNEFDLHSLLGMACMIGVQHQTKGEGDRKKVTAKVVSMQAVPKGITAKEPESELMKFSVNEKGFSFPANLPEWIIKRVIGNPEAHWPGPKQSCQEWLAMTPAERSLALKYHPSLIGNIQENPVENVESDEPWLVPDQGKPAEIPTWDDDDIPF